MIIEIKNGFLTAEIKTFGGELHSLKDKNATEYIWQGDKNSWPRQAPLLFPMVGRQIDDTTFFDGEEYKMLIHGFVRDFEFEVVSKTEKSVTLGFHSNQETMKKYPFEFIFQITYSLEETTLVQSFYVKNLSNVNMPFAVGGHPGFNCPLFKGETFEDYSIVFKKNAEVLESRLSADEKIGISKETSFDLDYDKFKDGAFIFENLECSSLKLLNKKTQKGVEVNYQGFPLLGLWTLETVNSPFLCVEPWFGMSNKQTTTPIEFRNNTALANLEPLDNFVKSITITVI